MARQYVPLAVVFILSLLSSAVAQVFSYGCYTEGSAGRALGGNFFVDYVNMTVEDCTAFCTGLSYTIWGIEYGGECYCGNALGTGSFSTFSAECGVACPGNPSETCGGGNHLSLYSSSSTAPAFTPVTHPAVTTAVYLGCYTEGNGTRALGSASAYDPHEMTDAACGNFCLNEGYLVYGTEYTAECWCGSALDPSSVAAAGTDCNMPCSGDATQVCGGSDRLSVYQWQ